jgi:hypothetical protein
MKKILFLLCFALFFVSTAFAQNKFEGYNIVLDVPENHRSPTCATRFVPPTTNITIVDLNPATPMNVTACDGSGTNLTKSSATTANMTANRTNFKWCFQGEDKLYRISFGGDPYRRTVVYNWIATPDEKTLGEYNVKDFGAKGDGKTDDTIAIQSALAYIATRYGGILFFPEGDYLVGGTMDFKGITLPSNVTIRGVGGLHSGASISDLTGRSASRIRLSVPNRALFRIGECTEKVSFRDIELSSSSSLKTYGIEALGAYHSSQDFHLDNVSFTDFYRGFYVYGLPQTNLNWQFDYIHLNRCRFVFNTDSGIYVNVRNTDWRIVDSLFINAPRTATQRGDSMNFERAGGILIENTFGGGFPNAIGGTYLNVLDSGGILVSHSQTEYMTNSFVYNEIRNPDAGDYSAPVTFLNSAFGNPIIFNARRTFVSTGNFYNADTFKADERLRVYSMGDRFCYDGFILGCRGATKNNFDKATVIFMTGQPGEGQVTGHPTFFGTDVEFGTPVQMPSFLHNALPQGKPNGSFLYCSNCRRNTTPCQAGGNGAPAMMVGGQWSCL